MTEQASAPRLAHPNDIAYRLNSRMMIDTAPPAQPTATYLNYRRPVGQENLLQAGPLPTSRSPIISEDEERYDSGLDSSSPTNITSQLPGLTGTKTPATAAPLRRAQGGSAMSSQSKATGLRRKGKTVRSSLSSEEMGSSSPVSIIEPFIGIQTDIPTGKLDAPFASEQVQFSNRGSVYVRGQKAQNVADRIDAGSLPLTVRDSPRASTQQGSIRAKALQEASPSLEDTLSIDGRMFSVDDRRLSRKVRSMYDMGMEFSKAEQERPMSANTDRTDQSQDEDTLGDLLPAGTLAPRFSIRVVSESPRSGSAMSAKSNRSSIMREPGEAAGGAEDWTDVQIGDVDRYGFIRPRSVASKRSSTMSTPLPGSPEPNRGNRPPSALPVIAETSSQSNTQSSPTNGYQHPTTNSYTTPTPLPTLRKRRSTAFDTFRSTRSRQRRLVAEASTMLDPRVGHGETALPSPTSSVDSARTRTERKRALKWEKMARPMSSPFTSGAVGAGTDYTFDTTDPKLISRTWKGIPDRWRATAWHSFLTTSASRHSPTGRPEPSDDSLISRFHTLQDQDCPDDVQIDMDVPRTIGRHVMFRRRYRGGQRLLFRVLRALAMHFPEVGYVQGMAALAATLLCYFDEERAFVVAVRMWVDRGVGWLYGRGFEGLMEALGEFETKWLGKVDADVGKRLEGLGVGPTAWGTKWYLTLFNYAVPFEAQLRIWDVFLLLGDGAGGRVGVEMAQKRGKVGVEGWKARPDLGVLHAVAAALLLAQREVLLKGEFEDVMGALTRGVPVREGGGEDVLMRVAGAVWREGAGVGR